MSTSYPSPLTPGRTIGRLYDEVERLGGAIRTRELHALGWSRAGISHLLARRQLIRARSGWFVRPGTARAVIHAVRVGGQLSGAHALAAHGIWCLRDATLHVRVPLNACQMRTATNPRLRLSQHPDARIAVHWTGVRAPEVGPRPVVAPLLDALHDYAKVAPRDMLLATVGDVIHQHLADRAALLSRFGISEWEGVDGVCESGTETLFFVRMLRMGLHPWRQVAYPGIGRVDFQFGSHLVVEVDGATFHDTAAQFARDRAKDALLAQRGVRVLRFSHDQVVTEWSNVAETMRAVTAVAAPLGSTRFDTP
ncbi:uncharacterized protein DUF559 [Microcella alkaliphila]|uniref:Uncharacterized protein DUF559 n=1 Tax=Microcella alkaliphila TaxID=279828 RepID=A0A4Q7TDU9_9MICO|nr:type IV toxin-antitoxin system AbiEi family antitoxin domain-containing protein [Microcella alkaliphila]RZT58353.1 uncharacterized protein DUF559 [Microcella alkaliphila]